MTKATKEQLKKAYSDDVIYYNYMAYIAISNQARIKYSQYAKMALGVFFGLCDCNKFNLFELDSKLRGLFGNFAVVYGDSFLCLAPEEKLPDIAERNKAKLTDDQKEFLDEVMQRREKRS